MGLRSAALNRRGAPVRSVTIAPDRGSYTKPGGTPAFTKAAGRKSDAKPAFRKQPAPCPTDPSGTSKCFIQPKKPRR